MIRRPTITAVIPCLNEARSLSRLLSGLPREITHVIVVDNGSTDHTVAVARKYGAKVLFERRKDTDESGYGYALLKGIHAAKTAYIVCLDGDDTYPTAPVSKIVRMMQRRHIRFVSCSRLPLEKYDALSITRRLGIFLLNVEIALLYGLWLQDALTGMWVVERKFIQELELKSGGWNFSAEIKLSALRKARNQFTEYHIDHFARIDDHSKLKIWRTGYNYFRYIFVRRLTIDNPLLHFIQGTAGHISSILISAGQNVAKSI